jgi:hypothetical protein
MKGRKQNSSPPRGIEPVLALKNLMSRDEFLKHFHDLSQCTKKTAELVQCNKPLPPHSMHLQTVLNALLFLLTQFSQELNLLETVDACSTEGLPSQGLKGDH